MDTKLMKNLGENGSVIRDLFDYANKRKAEIGADKVFDFSIGNPNVPPPEEVKNELIRLLQQEDSVALHGYTSASGDYNVKKTIADNLNKRFDTNFSANDLYMTEGAMASLSISLAAILEDGDEVILFAPYFPEYTVFVETVGGVVVSVESRPEDFQIDFEKLEKALNEKTKAVIINSPNNPSGAVLTKETIAKLSDMLYKKQEEFGHFIYLISDEPYRELVYGDIEISFVTKYYKNTIVCYSYSKALSIPGERIGYILVNPDMDNNKAVYSAVSGAGRALGYVCAPSLFQRMLINCDGLTSDISIYEKNRDILYNALTKFGFEVVHPDGAFYLFVKSPSKDANEFSERAKNHELMLVPSDDFGIKGYVRISYCVSTKQIEDSLCAFEKLAKEYF